MINNANTEEQILLSDRSFDDLIKQFILTEDFKLREPIAYEVMVGLFKSFHSLGRGINKVLDVWEPTLDHCRGVRTKFDFAVKRRDHDVAALTQSVCTALTIENKVRYVIQKIQEQKNNPTTTLTGSNNHEQMERI